MLSYNILEFAHNAKLVKSIPEEKSFIEWALRETQKNLLPFLLLIDTVGLEFLPIVIKIIMVFVIIFLPLWTLFGLFWILDDQKEERHSDYIDNTIFMDRVKENEGEDYDRSSKLYTTTENYPYKRIRTGSNRANRAHN